MAANSHFLALLQKQSVAWNVAYFLFILLSLVCLGGVLESRREFMMLEAARLTGTALAVLALGTWFGGVRDTRILASIAIFAVFSLGWLWIAARGRQETAVVAARLAMSPAVQNLGSKLMKDKGSADP
jgi:hypothetical protein